MKYLAMMQCYDHERNEDGTVKYYDVPNPWANNYPTAPATIKQAKRVKVDGKFRSFGANGKVVSLYDSAAKAARYCGTDGYVAELNPDDCRKYSASLVEQFAHCEARMLFWAAEADRLKKEMEAVNG